MYEFLWMTFDLCSSTAPDCWNASRAFSGLVERQIPWSCLSCGLEHATHTQRNTHAHNQQCSAQRLPNSAQVKGYVDCIMWPQHAPLCASVSLQLGSRRFFFRWKQFHQHLASSAFPARQMAICSNSKSSSHRCAAIQWIQAKRNLKKSVWWYTADVGQNHFSVLSSRVWRPKRAF